MKSAYKGAMGVILLLAAACGPSSPPADTVKPTVSLVAAPGSLTAAGNISLTATATDNVGVTRVEFYDGTNLVSTDNTPADGFSASIPLSAVDNGNKSYTAKAFDAAGNNETSVAQAVTVNIAGADSTPPSLSSSNPANNASGVAVGANIVLTFSEAMNTSALSVSTFPVVSLGDPTWNADNTVATFDPPTDLAAGTAYTLSISGQDVAGNALAATALAFTTAVAADNVPPTIESVTPAASSTNVPVSTNIQFSFSEPMNRASVEGAFSTTPASVCLWAWSSDSRQASCDPSANFAASTSVTVNLGTGARDAANNALAAAFSSTFTTAAAPDTTLPTLVSSVPTNSATGVERDANIVLTFSEPMDKISVQSSFNVSNPAGVTGGWSWNAAGTVATFNPNATFSYNQTVNWSLSNAARDLAGNALASSISRSFKTLRLLSKEIFSTASLDGNVSSNNQVQTEPVFIIPDGLTGDTSDNTVFRGFLSFDLTQLPADLIRVNEATLWVRQTSMSGNPYSSIGNLIAERIDYGTGLDASDYSRTPISGTLPSICFFCLPINVSGQVTLSTSTANGWKSANILNNLRLARNANASRFQWRLRFGSLSGGVNFSDNSTTDWIIFGTGNSADGYKPSIIVQYEAP